MPFLDNVTLAQIRAATKAQMINFITNRLNAMTKRQIILFLWDAVQDVQDNAPVRTYGADGQITSQLEVNSDTETDAQTGARQVTWTYYPTGEVDTITIKTFNAANALLSTKTIKHYTNGDQPTVTLS